MKKKLLFVLPSFEIGGTTVSTKNLILLLDKERYDTTVLSMTGSGVLKSMYDDVNQIQTTKLLSALSISSWKQKKGLIQKFFCGAIRMISHKSFIKEALIRFAIKQIPNIKSYDTVIACEEGLSTKLVSMLPVANKIAWVRCDYQNYCSDVNELKKELRIYSNFNSIVCVSQKTSEHFKSIFPNIANKVYAINNPQSSSFIIQQSKIDDCDSRFIKDGHTIVSIGRFSPVKRFWEIPNISIKLKNEGLKFRWFIIGDGNDTEYNNVMSTIIKNKVQDCVTCLGAKTNPHYYISQADLLVCLSSSEACPRVINESKILHTPVVSTDFPTVFEYLENGYDGIISPIQNISETILMILNDKNLYQKIKNNADKFVFDNDELMEKIVSII